jgi:iron complex outermembrane receptor protein
MVLPNKGGAKQMAKRTHVRLMCGAASAALLLWAGSAQAEAAGKVEIAPQSLASALNEFGVQTGRQVIFAPALTSAKTTAGVSANGDIEVALAQLLDGSGLTYQRDEDTFLIVRADADPQSGSAAGDGAEVEALIVTAQKREEDIQDVPIAISAFTQTALEEQKIEGGFDLLKAIPNVTFSKNNFTSYNFSIRGIGTKAVSATTDPGVAVSFNNASLIQNRLFEQEYFDVERVEVLRGPQGTLYGRNATAGVINVISAKPDMNEFKGSIKGEVGNYHSKRIVAMVNVPLVEDKLAVRFAGSLTNRTGYDFNDTTKHAVNGRDLWSGRLTIGFNPTEKLRTSLLWERFHEDDNRSRTGKQLCKRDLGPTHIGSSPVGLGPKTQELFAGIAFSQGCSPVSLYDDAAFETPNGHALPFVSALQFFAAGCISEEYPGFTDAPLPIGYTEEGNFGSVASVINCEDPYGGKNQSKDLRVINSFRDPIYRAGADIVQLDMHYDLTDILEFISQTTYDKDEVYSFQDFNRFNTEPVFNDSSNWYGADYINSVGATGPSPWRSLTPGGVFCDPQLGCSKTMAGFDISSATSTQFGQEFRLQSDFDGPVNFSAGANYTKFKVLVDYYVFFNLITAYAMIPPFNFQADPTKCNIVFTGLSSPQIVDPPVENGAPVSGCPYIDPNPVESINGDGHNYFRSKNPYKLSSGAVFGEVYWQLNDAVKVTAGLRYTDDRKTFTPVPSQILLADSFFNAGDVPRGYPEKPDIKQHWGEFTGRLGVDWKPELSFTDQTMVYAFYSRGYKGGGANPPGIGYTEQSQGERFLGWEPGQTCECIFDHLPLEPVAQNSSPTFRPEFVNAFEVGAKNTLLGGGLVFNTNAFFYDYKDYQVSKIVDRTASNENFDAKVWGLEFETVFSPTRNLRFIGNLGYLGTTIGSGAESIDIMNRTQGNEDWVLARPWVQLPSNCIVPKALAEQQLNSPNGQYLPGYPAAFHSWCGGVWIPFVTSVTPTDPNTGLPYDPLYYDGTNGWPNIHGGAGIMQNLKGNELPNSPHWTANIGAQYGFDFLEGWKATIRADGYWQSQSWARVYNAVNDKLHGWYNANLSLWLENDDGLKIEIYAKNILDKTPITDAFINSDDTVLTTNVFVLDPRLIGLSIRKDF